MHASLLRADRLWFINKGYSNASPIVISIKVDSKNFEKKFVLIGLNCVFGGIHVHENAAGHFKAAFGFEPDCNAHINLKVTFTKKNVRVSIVKTW